ncbi:MAG: magnesium transporter [Omnitrophica bacterium RIFCSPHIGHO2_02_FULL_46_11]|nr:MAG: magnesium transporter [Omnitrophica bacterium RIFCSPHIGHO2_02_FULL_46_11]OGW87349.1 MAG: magnesium transporter [Omnitrophica bacterium RIFCSPLOWO2_01_FULL_45_10b]
MESFPDTEERLTLEELRETWPVLSAEERAEGFALLDRNDALDFFLTLSPAEKKQILLAIPEHEGRLWMCLLPPDDAADVIQAAPHQFREKLFNFLDEKTRKEVHALLSYHQDVAGGLMNPRFARLRPDLTVDEAIRYLRLQAQDQLENIYYIYVLDEMQHLLGVVSFRELFKAPPEKQVREIMESDIITVTEHQDQEEISHLFSRHKFLAFPVVDAERRLKGIITADDILKAVQKEATEDIQKLGGMEAINFPYMQISFFQMLKKRAVWLAALFIGETLTASAMVHYEQEIARAVVLALFVPLIISSGGNSGSQAATLTIRAMALGEIRLRDWWRVIYRELGMGLGLGLILATIGFVRIILWENFFHLYGPHYFLIASTVALTLVGIVLWGTIAGSMLPFVLRRLGFDPASASAPFVATLVDVSGIMIYFTVAAILLRGTLL